MTPRPARLPWLALFACLTAVPAAAADLTVALHQGLAPAALRAAVIRPFAEATALAVDIQPWEGGASVLRARLEAAPGWDVISLTGAEALAGCESGVLEKLDWAALGGRDRLLPGGAGDCMVGLALNGLVLAWDRSKLAGQPGWADFGDVVKHPGRRGLRRQPRGTLEIALMADGAAPTEVYRLLRSEAGIERAFRKLDQLRPYVVWWQDEVEATRLLASGEVLMTSAPATRVAEAVRSDGRTLGLQWAGAVTGAIGLAIPRGARQPAVAVRLLAEATQSRAQAALPELAALGPLARGAAEAAPPEIAGFLATTPAALASALPTDEAFWRDNFARLAQRFDAWLPR